MSDPLDVIRAQRRAVLQDIKSQWAGDEDDPRTQALARTLDHIATQTTENHKLLFELIQNADDAQYNTNSLEKAELVIDISNPLFVVLSGNQLGFTEANVRAICNVAMSSKTQNAEQIGEKGLGFKACFSVFKTVSIFSDYYCFSLNDEPGTLGMVSPRILRED
ncbi:hypothetical protein PYCC9005_003584 [Savitreella phatthalungensis]